MANTLPFKDALQTADYKIRSRCLDIVITQYENLFERIKKTCIDHMLNENIFEIPLQSCSEGSLVLRKDGKYYDKENNESVELKDLPRFYETDDTYRLVHENMRSALLDLKKCVKESLVDSF